MSLTVPASVLKRITSGPLLATADLARSWKNQEVHLSTAELTDEALTSLTDAAAQAGDPSFGRVLGSIAAARSGDFSRSIPKLPAAPELLLSYLRHDLIHGWVFHRDDDGHLHPYLVTGAHLGIDRQGHREFLEVNLIANGAPGKLGSGRKTVTLSAEHVTRKKVGDVLLAMGLLKETPELIADHEGHVEAYRRVLTEGFAHQFKLTGTTLSAGYPTRSATYTNRKVVHDIAPTEIPAFADWAQSPLFDGGEGEGPVPTRTLLEVFDLAGHETMWVNTRDVREHVYDMSLREKIVLPDDQRELLDILVTDISTFTADIIEGKSAGNVILAKGKPGVGKTLTAEVYSELIAKPLYSIHSGALGTSAETIRKNLEKVFWRAKRWDAVLLLDEADVFVITRGVNIEQNAIVAEFLRTLEYFDGLMFMTTNRADDIDEAILSRCAAIIDYAVPDAAGARAVWKVQAANNKVTLPEPLLDELVEGFPGIAPRDIKMLLRLALRVAAHHGEPVTFDVFARCAMFRGLHAHQVRRAPVSAGTGGRP